MDAARRRLALFALGSVVDPEIGLDLVTLGMVYALEETSAEIRVRLTLTTAGCPLGDSILAMAEEALAGAFPGRAVRVDLVFEPAWSPAMISAEGRAALRV